MVKPVVKFRFELCAGFVGVCDCARRGVRRAGSEEAGECGVSADYVICFAV
jgi:hypothetical protein